MAEAVRLVVWDLDETFWRGTLTEGGITEYVQAHHDIVVELARRGIVGAICSRNDAAEVLPILADRGIADYFTFLSIDWGAKAARVQSLIASSGLRPESVMFIDDNAMNRAEAADLIPGLQVEDANFLPRLLDDPRFRGKDDRGLTRLTHYKQMAARNIDAARGGGLNADFLRGCDIRVRIEHDVMTHADRAVELINRTNQLNYTKRRLPEDAEAARSQLAAEISSRYCQAGLVRVSDRYGDYGFVGFFVVRSVRERQERLGVRQELQHFCFSCRTLGMYVEQWTYQHLGEPALKIAGDVLTDLTQERTIDWINLVTGPGEQVAQQDHVAPLMRLWGGCEAYALEIYLRAHAGEVQARGNLPTGGFLARIDSAPVALSTFNRSAAEFAAEAKALGLPAEVSAADYMAAAPPGTAFIFNFGLDAGRATRYRHRAHGWQVVLHPGANQHIDLTTATDAELQLLPVRDAANGTAHLMRIALHLRTHYESVGRLTHAERARDTRALIERVPPSCRLVILLNHAEVRGKDDLVRQAPAVAKHNQAMVELARDYEWVATASFSDVIHDPSEIQVGGNHYERIVILRMAQLLAETIRNLPGRA
jgi:FkbH-like protein